jgi:hypothetical protein
MSWWVQLHCPPRANKIGPGLTPKQSGSKAGLFNVLKCNSVSRVLFKSIIYLVPKSLSGSIDLPVKIGRAALLLRHKDGENLTYLVFQPIRFTLPPRLLGARWALTPPFHPYPNAASWLRRYIFCGTVCYRLACAAQHLPVRKYGALCCPDFPRADTRSTRDRKLHFNERWSSRYLSGRSILIKTISLLLHLGHSGDMTRQNTQGCPWPLIAFGFPYAICLRRCRE